MNPKTDTTNQIKEWSGQFGREYTDRNPHTPEEVEQLYQEQFGISRLGLNKEFLGSLDRNIRILEAGSNVGTQLMILQNMGFENLYGIELQEYAVEVSKKGTRNINIIQGNIFDIPFKDSYFDLVFTSGVLIHINPKDLPKAVAEIDRCSRRYIWGFEYYSETPKEVVYRGNDDLLWKCDFSQVYLNQFKNLKLLKEKRIKYLTNENFDSMFLLEK